MEDFSLFISFLTSDIYFRQACFITYIGNNTGMHWGQTTQITFSNDHANHQPPTTTNRGRDLGWPCRKEMSNKSTGKGRGRKLDFGDMEETREWKAFNILRTEPQTGPPRRRRTPRSGLGCGCGCAIVLLIFLLFAAGTVIGYLGFFRHDLVPADENSEKTVPVLILGVDRETKDEPGRSDTIILAFLNSKDKKVSLLSVPRDTYTDVPDLGKKDKINAAYALGGSEAAMETVGLLLDREIKYYLATDFQGFVEIVNTLGGITVPVDQEVSKGIDVPPGTQRLKGEDALRFVRYRGYPTADIERIKHQQIFLRAVADEAMRLRNIWKLPLLVGELRTAVDTNLSTAQLIDLGQVFKSVDSSQMDSYILPGRPQYINGISYWIPHTAQIEPLVKALYEGTPPPAQ